MLEGDIQVFMAKYVVETAYYIELRKSIQKNVFWSFFEIWYIHGAYKYALKCKSRDANSLEKSIRKLQILGIYALKDKRPFSVYSFILPI